MDTRLQNQAKAPSASSVSPVQTGLFQPRPFTDSEQEAAEASDLSHQSSNLQTQREPASHFGHNFSRVQVQTNTPSSIQSQLINRQPEEQQNEEEANEVAQPLKMMAPPVGEPIERESPEESIQMMPQWGRLTPAIQRQEQEEESIQMMPQLGLLAPVMQRQDQEEAIQTMPQVGFLTPAIQRQDQDDEPMQMMPQWGVIQRQETEGEEEPIQMKWLQAKLVVGALGDKYEQEADSVAAQVMSMSVPAANSMPIQRQGEGEEEETEPLVQRSPLADSITPLVQRQTDEQEDAIQAKSLLQRRGKGNAEAGSDVESQLNQSKGGGSPLPDEVRSFMEPRFGTDFSSVRVHTDSSAVQMNKDLRAQAFAHGSDIYYGSGKSPVTDALTAHELTHVVQQTGAKKLQAKSLIGLQSNKETLQAKISPATNTAIQLKKAPDSPQADPAFQAVVNKTKNVAQEHKKHPPAKTKATEAQSAAKPPANEVESKAQDKKVQEMNQQKPGQFNAGAFKAALMQKIAAITPQTLEEADKFKENNKIDSVKGEVSSKVTEEKKQASGPVEEKTKEAPNTSGITPKPVTPLPPNQAGAKPGDVGAAGAAPKPKDASEVSLQEGCQSIDKQMASANVTEEQLKKSNEPEFQGALAAKNTAQADAAKAPQDYRQQEQATLTQAQAQAQATASTQLQGMHGSKQKVLAQVLGNQSEAKGHDEQKRAEVANRIQGIYNTTKQKVEAALSQLDKDVNTQFEQGAGAAKTLFENHVDQQMKLYKEQRYSGVTGKLKWVKDTVVGMPSEVNVFYQKGKELYLASMGKTIDQISNFVSTKLNAAKTEIANGRQEIQKYVGGLDPSLRQVGQQAAQNIQGKFDELETSVDNKQDELIDSLAQKYNDNLKQLDDRIDAMKAENRGLVDKAKDAVGGVIKTIMQLKEMLMGVLSKAAGAIDKIIKDPIGFLGNLISGIKQGFQNFAGNIWEHLKKGMLAFLTGALAGAGITMPENFDLKGIFSLVMQVLGVVYDAIKSRVIKALGKNGEKMFSALESSFEMFVILKNEGVAGLWQFIQDKIGDLNAMVIDTIQTFLVESVIKAGVMWVLSLLNPASAFVRACKAIYDIIMFFIERGSQIAELVSAVTESVAAIASGAVGGAAKLIENALGTALPVVISFMASLLGLGGISEKIEGIIKKVRVPIDKAIDWLIAQAVKFAKKIGKALGFGKNEKEGKDNKEHENGKLKDGEVGETINFTAKGESHRLWVQVQGEKSVVMVASNPTPVAAFLDQPSVTALENSEGKERVKNARRLAQKVNLDAQQILQYIRGDKYEEAAKEDDEIEVEQKQLFGELKWIFDNLDSDGKLSSEKTLVKSRIGELEGRANRLLKAIGYDSDKYGHLAKPISDIQNERLQEIKKNVDHDQVKSREELKILVEEDLTNVDMELKSYETLLQDSIKKREELDAAVETDKDQWKDKERWEHAKALVQQILKNYKSRILEAVPGASVKFRGSLATGWKGPHKVDKETGAAKRFDPSNFDCDAYVELTDKMWVEELALTGLVPRGQNWAWLKDIRRWRRTAELEQVQIEIKQQLKDDVEGYKQEAGEPDFKMSLQSESEGIQKLLEGTAYPQGAFEKAGAGEIEKRMPSGRTRDDNRPGRRMMESSEEV